MGCSDTNYVGCSFSLKQRKAIERKNGRVTPCNRPGTEELRQSQKKTEDPVSFHFVFSVLHFFFCCTDTRI